MGKLTIRFDDICESQDYDHDQLFVTYDDYEHLEEKLKAAQETLEFYDNAIRKNWAVDLSELKVAAHNTLTKIRK